MKPDTALTIRHATLADIAALMVLEREAPTSAHWTDNQYENFFSGEGSRRLVLVAERTSAPILGFLAAHHIAPEWELENIVVADRSRRSGIGKRLLNVLIENAKQANSDAIFLEVRESNIPARSFYEKAGFRQTGRRRLYYSNPPEDAILYRLSLR